MKLGYIKAHNSVSEPGFDFRGGTPLPLKIGGVLESGGSVMGAFRGCFVDFSIRKIHRQLTRYREK